MSPPHCLPWWGRFLCRNSMFDSDLKLICNANDGCVFTVSCYDKYGNKCITSNGSQIIVTCESDSNDNDYNKSRQVWKDSSNSIFPCVLNAPSKVGLYRVKVFVNNDDNDDNQVKGSPFILTVNPRVAVLDDITVINENTNMQQPNDDDSNSNTNTNINESEEKEIIQLSKMDMTRKRAELALKKKRNLLKFEREMKMREKSVKRTGGGFIIKYSADI